MALGGITGLTGIAGYQSTDVTAQATAEQRLGSPANPFHGYRGEQAKPYSWQSKATQAANMQTGPLGPENQLLSDEFWFIEPAGDASQDPAMDTTPSRRAAPWPKGIASGPVPSEHPNDIVNQLRQSYDIHASGRQFNAARRMQLQQGPLNDEWASFENDDSGHTDVRPIDRQALSSGFMWGTRDRVQSMAAQNSFGYDGHHKYRRWATGGIPGNNMWLRPGGRPLVKSLPGPARPAVGPTSPFAGQDLGASFSINGAMLQNVPTEYVAPPTPNLAQAVRPMYTGDDAEIEWF